MIASCPTGDPSGDHHWGCHGGHVCVERICPLHQDWCPVSTSKDSWFKFTKSSIINLFSSITYPSPLQLMLYKGYPQHESPTIRNINLESNHVPIIHLLYSCQDLKFKGAINEPQQVTLLVCYQLQHLKFNLKPVSSTSFGKVYPNTPMFINCWPSTLTIY